jgi:hypothetical protein
MNHLVKEIILWPVRLTVRVKARTGRDGREEEKRKNIDNLDWGKRSCLFSIFYTETFERMWLKTGK